MQLISTLSQIHSSAGSVCCLRQTAVEEGLDAIERLKLAADLSESAVADC